MEPTQEPIAFDTQGNLIIPGVHSGNYVAGSSGWTINEDGSAEFNNLTIRGGTSISGLDLYYNGTPGAGRLIASLSSTSGVDQYGNQYLAGVTVYNWGISYAQLGNSSLTFGRFVGGQPDPNLANGADVSLGPGGLLLTSNVGLMGADASTVTYNPGDGGVTNPGNTEPYALMVDSLDTSVASFHLSGALIKTDISGTPYKWVSPVMASGWSNTSLQVHLDGNDNLVVVGEFAYTGASVTAASAQVITTALPAAYQPNSTGRSMPLVHRTSANIQKNVAASLMLNTTGTMSVFWGDGVAGTTHDVNGLNNGDRFWVAQSVPLGNQA